MNRKKSRVVQGYFQYGLLALAIVFFGLAVSGVLGEFFSVINLSFVSFLNRDNLYSQYDKKFLATPRDKNNLFLFFDLDLSSQNMQSEISKIVIAYQWSKFIKQESSLKVHMIITPNNLTDKGISDLKSYLSNFDQDLSMLGQQRLSVAIAYDNIFKKKHGISSGTNLVVFKDDGSPDILRLDNIWMIYAADSLSFINHWSNILNKYLKQIEDNPIEANPKGDNSGAETDSLESLI